jgi:enoyl-CoA hydratase/carnithine racemase
VSAIAVATEDLIITKDGSLGLITLNRPKAINALTLEMTRGISAALDAFEADPSISVVLIEGSGERGFCAGGDLRGLYDSIRAGGDLGKIFWREEYILNSRIAAYPKPYVAYMNGMVMGGGVGLSAHGRHRVVTEKTVVAMPEVGIGFIPDVGGTWLLANAPGELGTYFGLTGSPMDAADAIHCGLGDLCITTARWPEIRVALARLGPGTTNRSVREVLGQSAAPTMSTTVEEHKAVTDRCFAFDAVEEILAALLSEQSEFAQKTRQTMLEKSPTSLKVTLRLLRAARGSTSLDQCLIREYDAALTSFRSRDFVEGIRAAVIDKDRKPQWSPAHVAEVTPEMVDAYFARHSDDRLVLPNRGRK